MDILETFLLPRPRAQRIIHGPLNVATASAMATFRLAKSIRLHTASFRQVANMRCHTQSRTSLAGVTEEWCKREARKGQEAFVRNKCINRAPWLRHHQTRDTSDLNTPQPFKNLQCNSLVTTCYNVRQIASVLLGGQSVFHLICIKFEGDCYLHHLPTNMLT